MMLFCTPTGHSQHLFLCCLSSTGCCYYLVTAHLTYVLFCGAGMEPRSWGYYPSAHPWATLWPLSFEFVICVSSLANTCLGFCLFIVYVHAQWCVCVCVCLLKSRANRSGAGSPSWLSPTLFWGRYFLLLLLLSSVLTFELSLILLSRSPTLL